MLADPSGSGGRAGTSGGALDDDALSPVGGADDGLDVPLFLTFPPLPRCGEWPSRACLR